MWLKLLCFLCILSFVSAACPNVCPNCKPRPIGTRDITTWQDDADTLNDWNNMEEHRRDVQMADNNISRDKRSGSKPPLVEVSDYVKYHVARLVGFEDVLPPIINFEEIHYKKTGSTVATNAYVFRIENPMNHFSVRAPGNIHCPGFYATSQTSEAADCILGMNGGFFDIKTGDCIGNVISEGNLIQISGLENTNFGITKNGEYVVGYLTQQDASNSSFEFAELISGMLWLVREGKPYYCESYDIEQPFSYFMDQLTARTIVGHDTSGRLFLIQIEGNEKLGKGLNVKETAEFALSLNLWNVVNLDGGGSSTVFYQGKVLNELVDRCSSTSTETCERKVTTTVCIK